MCILPYFGEAIASCEAAGGRDAQSLRPSASQMYGFVVEFPRDAVMEANLAESGWLRGRRCRRHGNHRRPFLLVYDPPSETEALESERDYGGLLPGVDN